MKFSMAILAISATLAIAAPTLNSRITSEGHDQMGAVKRGVPARPESANEKRGLLLSLEPGTIGDLSNVKRDEMAQLEIANE
ncbi:hypothetical protein N7517_003853 [Penicillium concentricum]|uniref:Uncharacterized protein n=1 Tax=Penicillium concentricum TaxID=293559 RepID=A0A9W9V7P9_9EURO|nr:uncharacterized protein N7517_003853 [Penicillium concentricum]KAJ5371847.1 hypothetical protein N7517_003853 [Penicillium concentricum]